VHLPDQEAAQSFGLLRLPRIPELKDTPCDDWEDADVNVSLISVCSVRLLNLSPRQQWDTYRYSDDSQEKKLLISRQTLDELLSQEKRTEGR
jgi:ATP-dependent RNA helicase DDX55/SPB4